MNSKPESRLARPQGRLNKEDANMYNTAADLITAAILALRPDRPYTVITVSIKAQSVTLHFLGDPHHTTWKAAESAHPTSDRPAKRRTRK